MRIIFTFLLYISTVSLIGQDTIFYDIDWNIVQSLNESGYYKIVDFNDSDKDKIIERFYYSSGQIKSEDEYSSYSENKKILNGLRKEWFENGQLSKEINFKDNIFQEQVIIYWKNGQLKRIDNYSNGEYVDGQCWDSTGTEVEHYLYLVMPEYPGGIKKLFKYLSKNIKYPKEAKSRNIQGKVIVSFVINRDGTIDEAEVIESVDKELDAEALRVVNKMPKWNPGKEDGENVRIQYNLPINFILHKK